MSPIESEMPDPLDVIKRKDFSTKNADEIGEEEDEVEDELPKILKTSGRRHSQQTGESSRRFSHEMKDGDSSRRYSRELHEVRNGESSRSPTRAGTSDLRDTNSLDEEEQDTVAKGGRRGSKGTIAGAIPSFRKHKHGKAKLSLPRTVSFIDDSHGLSVKRRLQRGKKQNDLASKRKRPSDSRASSTSDLHSDSDHDSLDSSDHDDDTVYSDDRSSIWTADEDGDTATALASDEDLAHTEDEEELQMKSGFYVPRFLRKYQEKRKKRKLERMREDEERQKMSAKDRLVYRRLPLISGCVSPFAIMLEIPGLSSPQWYVHITPQGQQNIYRTNPVILEVGLAISFASAVIANIAILGRFSERMRPKLATIIAVCGLVLHDVLNICALMIFGIVHRFNDGYTYSEAYWMTTASTATSLICTVTLIIDYVKTKDFRHAGSGITKKQSELVILVMAWLVYLSITAMIFAFVINLSFLDAVYFSTISLTSTGLGDIICDNVASKILLFFLASGGIVLLGVLIACARSNILDEFEHAYRKRRLQYRERLAERQEQRKEHRKIRSQVRNQAHKPTGRGGGRGGQSAKVALAAAASNDPSNLSLQRTDTVMSHFGPLSHAWTFSSEMVKDSDAAPAKSRWWHSFDISNGFSRNAPIASPEPVAKPVALNAGLKLTTSNGENSEKLPRTLTATSSMTAESASEYLRQQEEALISHRKNIEQNFDAFRKNLARAQRTEFWFKVGASAGLFVLYWIVGAVIYSRIEDYSVFNSFYFIYTVASTIGYGSYSPLTAFGRVFCIIWSLLGVAILTILFSVVSDSFQNSVQTQRLAEGRKAKKASKIKTKLKAWTEKILPPKIQDKRRIRRMKRKKKQAKRDAEKETQLNEKSESTPSPTSTTGILVGTDTANGKIVDGDDAEITQTGKDDGASDASVHGSLREPHANAKDVSELHLKMTSAAMEFHRNATSFMEVMRETLLQHIHNVPDIIANLQKLADVSSQSSSKSSDYASKQKILNETREKMIASASQSEEPQVVRALGQYVLLHEFEASLHELIHQSSTFIEIARLKNERLEWAEGEVDRLRQKILDFDQDTTDELPGPSILDTSLDQQES